MPPRKPAIRRLTTQAAIWREVARRVCAHPYQFGLCDHLCSLLAEGQITLDQEAREGRRVYARQPKGPRHGSGFYFWPFSRVGTAARLAMCRTLAQPDAPKKKTRAL